MSKPFANPFFDADISKFFDLSKISGSRVPQFDAEAVFALQRKNIEAYTALTQAAFESFQSLWTRQTEAVRQLIEESSQNAQAIASCPSPEEKVIKQAEVSKVALEKCIANVRDIAETVAKCNTQALDTVSTRINEGLDELRGIVKTNRAA